MRHPISLAIALSAALAVAPAVARAQDTVRTASRGEVATSSAFSSLISAVNATVLITDRIKNLKSIDAKAVHVVQTSTVVTPTNQKTFEDALERNKSFLGALRKAIGAQAELGEALASNTPAFSVNDVVAAEVGPNRQVTLYVRHT